MSQHSIIPEQSCHSDITCDFHWLSDTKYKWKMFFSHTTGGLGIGHVTYGGQLHPPLLTCFPTLPPTDFKFSFSCYPILRIYMYKFLVEFAIKVRLWRSA